MSEIARNILRILWDDRYGHLESATLEDIEKIAASIPDGRAADALYEMVALADKIALEVSQYNPSDLSSAAACDTARDTERVNFLESAARRSVTGISFDSPRPGTWRFMRRTFIGEACPSLRKAVDLAMADKNVPR